MYEATTWNESQVRFKQTKGFNLQLVMGPQTRSGLNVSSGELLLSLYRTKIKLLCLVITNSSKHNNQILP